MRYVKDFARILVLTEASQRFWEKRDSSEYRGNDYKNRIREMKQVKVPSMNPAL
jgi:hypothetical protein